MIRNCIAFCSFIPTVNFFENPCACITYTLTQIIKKIKCRNLAGIRYIIFFILFFLGQVEVFGFSVVADNVTYDYYNQYWYGNNAYLSQNGLFIKADKVFVSGNKLFGYGDLVIRDNENSMIVADKGFVNAEDSRMILSKAIGYNFKTKDLIIAEQARKSSSEVYFLKKAIYTPCDLCQTQPFWYIKSEATRVDFDKQEAKYKNASFWMMGVPVLYAPRLVHPLKNAPARSGVLLPSKHRSTFMLPFYYRHAKNSDMTFTPRVTLSGKWVWDLEGRLLTHNGIYKGFGSVNDKDSYWYLDADYNDSQEIKGFKFVNASSKSFIKKYHKNYDSILTSKVFFGSYNPDYFYDLKMLYFHTLPHEGISERHSIATPFSIYAYENFDDFIVSAKTQNMYYKQNNDKETIRSSNLISFTKQHRTDNGQQLDLSLNSQINSYIFRNNQLEMTILPELQAKWTCPLISSANTIIEPKAHLTLDLGNNHNYIPYIDDRTVFLNNANIFNGLNNGILRDLNEHGHRLNYGIYSVKFLDIGYVDIFGGVSHSFANKYSSSFIGSMALNLDQFLIYNNIIAPYSKARMNSQTLSLNEVGILYKGDDLYLNTKLVQYDLATTSSAEHDKQYQLKLNTSYAFTQQWRLGLDLRVDLLSNKILQEGVDIVYHNDCFMMKATFSNDRTVNEDGTFDKLPSLSLSIGLKNINM